MTIDRYSPEPLYQQLAAILRARLESGEFAPGATFPSIAELGREYNLGRDAVKAALQMLKDEGLLMGLPARGTYVPPNGWDARP